MDGLDKIIEQISIQKDKLLKVGLKPSSVTLGTNLIHKFKCEGYHIEITPYLRCMGLRVYPTPIENVIAVAPKFDTDGVV